MKQNPLLTTSALVLAASTALYAQTNPPAATPPAKPGPGLVNEWLRKENPDNVAWDIGGQVRARYEIKEGFGAPIATGLPGAPGPADFRDVGGNKENVYLLLREKVHVGYTQPWWSVYVEARDSGTYFGDDRQPDPETDRIDLHQAYLAIGNRKESPFSIKVGRQELSYGDERLVGAFDWNNIGRVFDTAKFRFETKDVWVDAFVSKPVLANDGRFNTWNDYETFSGVYASTKTLIPKQETQVYFLARNTGLKSPLAQQGAQPQPGGLPARDIYTVGLRIKSLPGQLKGWDYGAELMAQFGSFRETDAKAGPALNTRLNHEAYAVALTGGYTWTDAPGTPRLGIEYDYATGDSNPQDKSHGTFDNLFPTNHKFYGYMDFISLQNIHDIRLNTSIKPCKDFSLLAEFHLFWLADTHDNFYTVGGGRRGNTGTTAGTGYGINPGYGSFVGSELDIIGTYTITPYATAQVGYGHFFVGDYVKSTFAAPGVGSRDADYVYLQMTLNF